MDIKTTRSRALLDDSLYAYLLANQAPEHAELQKLRETTKAMPRGRMQIAPEQGHLLAFLARLIGAHRTLEIGTFTGYSALTVALALPADGRVLCCDISEVWVDIGRPFWGRAGVASKIETRIGPALETLRSLEDEGEVDSFDMAFVDADKENLDGYYEGCLRLVRPGGLIVFDNMLHHGTVADPANAELSTIAVRKHNAKIAADGRVDRVLLPVGDGMILVRRRHC